jgi:benzoate/toluate 1,2-dioxygenase beta subunit
MPRTTHVIGIVELVDADAAKGEYRVASAFVMAEYRDDRRRIFSGRCAHTVRGVEGGLRIALKRVDLVDCDGLHAAMAIPF